jgi:AcrR family transcriptional regulator
MARDDRADRAERCLADADSRTTAALAKASGIPRATLYRRYSDLVEDFAQRCGQTETVEPGTVAGLRRNLADLRDRDRQRLARISDLEAENHALRNSARLLRAENAELRVAHDEGRAARIVPLDRPAGRADVGALSWEQLRAEHLALIAEHAETKAELQRARRIIGRLSGKQPKRSS